MSLLHRSFTLLGGVLALTLEVKAATFIVDAELDAPDASSGDGACVSTNGDCTLRAAVMETNALVGADRILLPAGTYSLIESDPDEDLSRAGDLDVTDELEILGEGRDATLVRADYGCVLSALPGSQLVLRSMSLAGGMYASGGQLPVAFTQGPRS